MADPGRRPDERNRPSLDGRSPAGETWLDDGRLRISPRFASPDAGRSTTLAVAVCGHLETHNSRDASTALHTVFALNPVPTRLILDLSRLTYVSSTGVGTLVTILTECQSAGVEMIVADPTDAVVKILDLLGFTSFFTITYGNTDPL